MNAQEIIEIETKHSSGTYTKQPLVIVRGQGASLFDIDGVEYLDCSSGHGVANLGHAHPKIAEALYQQANKIITLFEAFPNDQRAMLMEKITKICPRSGQGLPVQLRHGSCGSGLQVRTSFHGQKKYCRCDASLSWTDVWLIIRDL